MKLGALIVLVRMTTKGNRFALLDLDSDEEHPFAVPPPVVEVQEPPQETSRKKEQKNREWNVDTNHSGAFRHWNKANHHNRQNLQRKQFFRSYAFRDDEPSKFATYAFKDEAPSSEPIELNERNFPKLNDYVRPHTPPYPPDDKPYPSLAERIQMTPAPSPAAQEQKEKDIYVLKMDTFIPSRDYTMQIT